MVAFHVSASHADVLLIDRPNDAILIAHDLLDTLQKRVLEGQSQHGEVLVTPRLPRTQALTDFIERFRDTPEWGWWPNQTPRPARLDCYA